MTDAQNNEAPRSKLTLSGDKKFSLKQPATEQGQVRQKLAQGRSNTVMVEVKKRFVRPAPMGMQMGGKSQDTSLGVSAFKSTSDRDMTLTAGERDMRMRVFREAAERAATAQERAAALAEERAMQGLPEDNNPPTTESEDPALDTVAVSPAPPITPYVEADAAFEKHDKKPVSASTAKLHDKFGEDEADKKTKGDAKPIAPRNRFEEPRRTAGKILITSIRDDEEDPVRSRSLASIRRARAKAKRVDEQRPAAEKVVREIILPEVITVQELAVRMATRVVDVIRELMKMGMIVTAHQSIDADTAELVIDTCGHKCKRVTDSDIENNLIAERKSDSTALLPRPPVVAVMGHVDHGKTSLLDALRSSDVASGEAGGITQHIGAYTITTASGQHITFLDTPGHEAFTAMRSRGASITDIVVLVVAADDGIMAQTKEAINHAKAAGVTIIVAINKIDKPGADPARVRNELLSHELVSEEFGGDTMVVEVSAKERLNLDRLIDTILLQAELMDLKASVDCAAHGYVIESKVDKGRGVVATLLISQGTLRVGDIVVVGASSGRVRAMNDDKGKILEAALPAMPVEIIGLDETPDAGDMFDAVVTEKQARDISEFRQRRERLLRTAKVQKTSLEELFQKAADGGKKELALIIKGDVHGSVEAIATAVEKLASEEVKIHILHAAVGGINESDIALAQATHGLVIGFNVRATVGAKELAARERVDVRYYSIIYNVLDDMKLLLGGMHAPILREEYLGTAEVRQVFTISKTNKRIAGCYVQDGLIKRGAKVRLLRDDIVIHEGTLKTLRRFKEDVKEVRTNFECGIAFENYDDLREKDRIEAFDVIAERVVL